MKAVFPAVLRITPNLRRRQRRLRGTARFVRDLVQTFQLRHRALLGQYEDLVRRGDQLESRRESVARQIQALERAIRALEPEGRRAS